MEAKPAVSEISGALWLSPDPETRPGPGLWDPETNSLRGRSSSFRADEAEESALCCSLSVSEDGLSEYSESQSHYGSESGSKKSGRGGSAGASPLTTASDRSSSYPGTRSMPSPAFPSSGVASSALATGASPSASASESASASAAPVASVAAPAVPPPDDGDVSPAPETGNVSPKRRGQVKAGAKKTAAPNAAKDPLPRGWLGRPAAHSAAAGPPARSQVFQSCLRPGIGSVRTIIEEDEEGWDDTASDEGALPSERTPYQANQRASGGEAIPKTKTEERPADDQSDPQPAKAHFFIRSSSDQTKGGLDPRHKGGPWTNGRPPVQEAPGCLCPVANTPTEGSSVANSPPGSPRGDKLSSMSVYFCGLPGPGYGRRRRSCGLCGRQVGRRAPQCSLCRLAVYCDRRCMEQHQAAHSRTCPGASAKRLRDAASVLSRAESGAQKDKRSEAEDHTPLRRTAAEQGDKKASTVATEAREPADGAAAELGQNASSSGAATDTARSPPSGIAGTPQSKGSGDACGPVASASPNDMSVSSTVTQAHSGAGEGSSNLAVLSPA